MLLPICVAPVKNNIFVDLISGASPWFKSLPYARWSRFA